MIKRIKSRWQTQRGQFRNQSELSRLLPPGLFKGSSRTGECSQLSGKRQQEFLESLIFSARPNTDSSSNSVTQRIQTNSPEETQDSPTTPPGWCLFSQLYRDREETEWKEAKQLPSQITTRLRCFQPTKALPSPPLQRALGEDLEDQVPWGRGEPAWWSRGVA